SIADVGVAEAGIRARRGAAGHAINSFAADQRRHVPVFAPQRVSLVAVIVHLDVDVVAIKAWNTRSEIVIHIAREVRLRIETNDLLGDGAKPIRRDSVAGEWSAPGPVRIARVRIVDNCRDPAEVATSQIICRDGVARYRPLALPRNVPASEEEEFVFHDRPTQSEAIIVVNAERLVDARRLKKVTRFRDWLA